MNIIQLSPQFNSQPRNQNPRMIVVHSTGGSSLSGAIDTLRAKGLGYHFLIDKDGRVYQGCRMDRKCGHAGNSYGPLEAERNISKKQDSHANFIKKTSVNDYSIGMSFVQDLDEELTIEQLHAAQELLNFILRAKPYIRWITGHKDVSPHRKIDPYSNSIVTMLGRQFHLDIYKAVP